MRTLLSLGAASAATAVLLFVATSNSTSASAPTPTAPAVATKFTIDTGHSNIMFRCKHLGVAYQWGRFDAFTGSFTLADAAEESMVEVTVDAASVNSNSKDRDNHLRGPDFFNVKQFPEMTFKSTKVVMADDGKYSVTGDLTLHGVTKDVTMSVQKIGEADTRMGRRAGFEGTFVIDRMDFGVEALGDALGHDVTMTFAIEGVADGK